MILTTALQAVCDWLEINADSPAYDDSGGKTIKQVIQEANNADMEMQDRVQSFLPTIEVIDDD